MRYINNWLTLLIAVSFMLSGCAATPTPIREMISTGSPDASRISITSINEANIFDRNSVLPGKIYINGAFYGEFSKNQRDFAVEVLPGTHLIVVCPESDNKCINVQLNVLPNKDYKYKYTLTNDYMVIAARFTWKLVPLGVEDYRPVTIKSRQPAVDASPQSRDISKYSQPNIGNSNVSEEEKKMEEGKTRCSALGFQIGTQSFGECILRLSK